MEPIVTSIRTQGEVRDRPLETYGNGEVVLRIGNGGAGATKLIEALALDYLSTQRSSYSIQWVCNHSRNSQMALLYGYVDIALTYERDQEEIAVSEGWAKSAGCLFHDHFCLVGPLSDPADVRCCRTVREAFQRIARKQALFHSRADGSATMHKERSIWRACNLNPWDSGSNEQWYVANSHHSPTDALLDADGAGAYLLIDRSTLLRQTSLNAVSKLTVFFEPLSPSDILMNSCYALYSPRSPSEVAREIRRFLSYVKSPRGQSVIENFGKGQVKYSLFATLDQKYARTQLAGGRPKGGRWVSDKHVLAKL